GEFHSLEVRQETGEKVLKIEFKCHALTLKFQCQVEPKCPLWVKSGLVQRTRCVRVWTLITSSNLVACATGRSPGFAPLRIRAGINADLPICIRNVGGVAHEPANFGKFAPRI
ncbi:MAG: hypothetical protein WCD60_00435, partial [Pseudolabrys sp.]